VSGVDSVTEWLLVDVDSFDHEGAEISQVICVNRYSADQDLFGEVQGGNRATVNLMFRKDGRKTKEDAVAAELSDDSHLAFLIGSFATTSDR